MGSSSIRLNSNERESLALTAGRVLDHTDSARHALTIKIELKHSRRMVEGKKKPEKELKKLANKLVPGGRPN